jgi:hypothetical protein
MATATALPAAKPLTRRQRFLKWAAIVIAIAL